MVELVSIIKRIMIVVLAAVTIFICTKLISLLLNKQKNSLPIVISSSLNQRELELADKQPVLLKSKILDVPLINQLSAPRLYNGCEVTSLAMILHYNGINVSKNKLAETIKTVPLNYGKGLKGNPNEGFVGDMEDGPGLGVYNGPIYDLAKKYVGDRVVNLTDSPFTDLLRKVSQGHPVWIITTTTFAPVSVFEKWHTPQGTIEITFNEHSAVITGYDEQFVYINDPYGFKNRKLNRSKFEKAWEQMGSQAIVIN